MKKFSEYLTEAVEQLDEISKEKLGNYIEKAKKSHRALDNKSINYAVETLRSIHDGDLRKAADYEKKSYDVGDKAKMRQNKINIANKKLTGNAKVSAKD